MAKAELRSNFEKLHGRAGNYINYYVKGRQLVRSYAVPRNPRTAAQQKNRCTFAAAVKSWQELSPEQKMFYNRKTKNKPYSGYNLYISIIMKDESLPVAGAARSRIMDRSFHVPGIIRINSVSIPNLYWTVPGYMLKPRILQAITEIPGSTAA